MARALIFITLIFLWSSKTYAQYSDQQKAAFGFMEAAGVEENMDTMSNQLLDMQIRQDPTLAPYKHVLQEWDRRYLSYDAIKTQLAEVYLGYFSPQELDELAAFFSTGVGQKFVNTSPDIMAETTEIGASTAELHMYKLQEMMMVEAERIQRLQSQ